MLFYFSGTGNTLWVARQISQATNEQLYNIPEELKKHDSTCTYNMKKDECIGFAFPVHSWGMPTIVSNFLKKLSLNGYSQNYIYCICTCGDDIGLTDKSFKKEIAKHGWLLNGVFSVQMPNTYVCLPGFDVDAKNVEKQKIAGALDTIQTIKNHILAREETTLVVPGAYAWIKSNILQKLFLCMQNGLSDHPFHVTDDCIGCSLCASACPVENIEFNNGKPKWSGHCTNCLACYHICPAHAVRYGRQTEKKGQYNLESLLKDNNKIADNSEQ
jgi:formate hydrogenlyase subunit 6/NADH:ubiquinone oxidoreductase subunit I